MAELIKLANCDKAERLADLVFVHGLDGDARKTWHPKDNPETFWPEWLGEDFPDLGVWSLDYDVASSAWKGHSMPLVDRATNVMETLDLEDIGQRPVAFVCHSLGGLLIKQALRLASDSINARYRDIAARTQLVVFLSTPHSGADMANWIAHIGKLLRPTMSVEELQAHHPRLLELNKWYRDHVAELGVKTFVYCEKLPTNGVLVVNQTTADPGIPGVDVIPLDEDHISICKLSTKNQVYRRIHRLLHDHLLSDSSSLNPSSAPPTTEIGRLKVTLCERLLSDWPKLADYFDISPADRARFDRGREPHSVWEWLQSHGRFGELAEGLRYIHRDDLAELLDHPT